MSAHRRPARATEFNAPFQAYAVPNMAFERTPGYASSFFRSWWPGAGRSMASEVGDNCRENGLLVSAEEDILMLFPALTITRKPPSADSTSSEKSL